MKKTVITVLAAVLALNSVFAASKKKAQVVKIGVTGSVYDELWAPAKKALKAEGIELKLVQFADYVTPNNALSNGEIDLNGFQHRIYFASDSKAHGYKISIIGNTFVTPLNVYSTKIKSVNELRKGSIVAIPNDVTNGGRALKVLEAAGLVKLNPNAGFNPSIDDIIENPKGIVLKQLAANTIPSALNDVDAAAINGNYAIDFNIDPKIAIFKDVLADKEYWNLIAARTSDLQDKEKVALYDKIVKAYQSEATLKVYNEDYNGYYAAFGWDIDELAQYK